MSNLTDKDSDMLANELINIARQQSCMMIDDTTAPHVLMRPKIYRDGDKWCALYGDDIIVGVAGFGKCPREACSNFDASWDGV